MYDWKSCIEFVKGVGAGPPAPFCPPGVASAPWPRLYNPDRLWAKGQSTRFANREANLANKQGCDIRSHPCIKKRLAYIPRPDMVWIPDMQSGTKGITK
jgi:hypothetical protein